MSSRPGIFKSLRRRFSQKRGFVNDFPYRPDDLVIASYPKSGSTWLRFIFTELVSGGTTEADFQRTQHLVPEISRAAAGQGVDFEALTSPRVLRSHALYHACFPKVVYLLRDGRDVMVSYYFHFKKFRGFDGTFDAFLRGPHPGVKWDDHVESWLFRKEPNPNLCLIRYEDMLLDTVAEVEKIVRFAGLPWTEEEIRRAVERSTFERMRAVEEKNGLAIPRAQHSEIRFVRKGGSGGWREHFGEREKDFFKKKFGETLIKTGYETSNDW